MTTESLSLPGPLTLPTTLVFQPDSYVKPLDLGRVFPQAQPLEVELGAGDGSFLAQYARRHPDRNFLGVERLLGRLRKLDRKGLRAGLPNLRLLRIEAAYCVEYLLPPASVRTFHVYFPDPWPKRRHWKHRLINPGFVAAASRALEPGGCLHLRTDSADYHVWMQAAFAADCRFARDEAPAELVAVVTDFEQEFTRKGSPTLRASYRLTPAAGAASA